jgi:hypothetical protein
MKPYAIVQQVHRHPGGRVGLLAALGRNIDIDRSPESVLGRKNCGDPKPFAEQPVEIAGAVSVYPGLIGHETDPAITDQVQAVLKQDVDPW